VTVERPMTCEDAGAPPAGLDTESVIEQLWGACYHRLLLPNQPLEYDFADELLDNLLRGVAS